MCLHTIDFPQGCQDHSRERTDSSTNSAKAIGTYIQKNEAGLLPHTIQKISSNGSIT